MQAAHNAAGRAAFIVLHENDGTHLFVELLFGVALEELSTGIGEHFRLDDYHSIYICFDYFHFLFG